MLLEELDRVGILFEITRGESLVGGVKGCVKLLSLNDVENIEPLSLSWINTGWVVSANVQHDNRVVLAGLQIGLQSLEVESLCLGVVVAVILNLVANELADSVVNGPGGLGGHEIDILVRVPLSKKCKSKTQSASTRKCLGTGESPLFQSSTVRTEAKNLALMDVGVNTLDRGVLVIHFALKNQLFCAPDTFKNLRLSCVITVHTHTKQDLVRASFLLEGIVKSKNGVSGGSRQTRPATEGSSALDYDLAVSTLNEASEHFEFL